MNPHVYLRHTKGKNIFRLKYTQERSSTSRGKPGATKKVKNETVEVLQEQTLKTVPKHTQKGAPALKSYATHFGSIRGLIWNAERYCG